MQQLERLTNETADRVPARIGGDLKAKFRTNLRDSMSHIPANTSLKIFTDGVCEPNPNGLACFGIVALDAQGYEVAKSHGVVGEGMTNNRAAYAAVIAALEWLTEHEPQTLATIYTDSQLLINQVRGEWACNTLHLQLLRSRVLELMQQTTAELCVISRTENSRAEALAGQAYRAEVRARQERSHYDAA